MFVYIRVLCYYYKQGKSVIIYTVAVSSHYGGIFVPDRKKGGDANGFMVWSYSVYDLHCCVSSSGLPDLQKKIAAQPEKLAAI